MVVFQQNHVEQADTVVYTATDLHCHFLEDTHARSSLASIEYTGIRTFQLLGILMCHGGNATHALHDVQHQTLRLQQRLYLAFHNHGHITRLYGCTVINEHFHLHGRIETAEHLLCYLDTGQDARFFYQQFGFAHCRSRNARKGCMVSIAYIFGESQVYQPVNQFFFLIHLFYLSLFDV